MTPDTQLELDIQSTNPPAPRISINYLENNIVHTDIVKYVSRSGQILRWAILTTRSGYAVAGKPSVAVSPENDSAEIGERIAVQNAKDELWPLMGYALKEQLSSK